MSEPSFRRAPGITRDLVNTYQNKKGYSHHPETLRWKGKLKALYLRHELLVREFKNRSYQHKSNLTKRFAVGCGRQNKFVNSYKEQLIILRRKKCGCKI
jgi:hypothetical protein